MPSPTPVSTSSFTRRDLHDGWTVSVAGGPAPADIAAAPIAARVPGVVHLDLMAAGLIADPYLDNNEALLEWVGLVDWTYTTTFTMTDAARASADCHELVFEGLDTVAAVSLNGEVIAKVANQHRTYRFDVTDKLRTGSNDLTVAFESPVAYATAQSVALGARPGAYPLPYQTIRKSACNFGWDWGIATFTSGIWRDVHLDSWSTARLADVRVHAEPEGDGGRVTASITVDRRGSDAALSLEIVVDDAAAQVELAAGATSATVQVEVAHVERWWPAGYGEQPLYDVVVSLRGADETPDHTHTLDHTHMLDRVHRRVGFRTVRWNTESDEAGTPFQLIINDQPVFVKGVNWIPDDAFFPRVDRERYRQRLTQAAAAHINLVRVWGGGIYESDDFFDLCDELGLLTWQDFLFACAAYPEEEPLRSEVEAEARDNVARLAHRASLVLLTGNNENIWGHEAWGWKQLLDGKTWGAHYYYELLPHVVAELAPHVAYASGSPFSPHGEFPNAEEHGSVHLWEQWNRLDWTTYRDHTPRFVAEFGWQGPPSWTTLTRSISDIPLTPDSPGMIVHQKAGDGNTKLWAGLTLHYRKPDDIETWHWAMQLNQANAVGFALDHFRSYNPHTTGAIVWQLNDCWPVTSWAAIDGDGREKPLYFALKNAFAPRVVTLQPRDQGLAAVIGNDTAAAWTGELIVRRLSFAGATLAAQHVAVAVPPRSTSTVVLTDAVAVAGAAASEVLVAEVSGSDPQRGFWFFAEPRDSALEDPELSVTVAADGDGFAVSVTAARLARDVALLIDKVAPTASVDSGMITLLAGETHVFRVSGAESVTAASLADPRVLRSGNQLVAG